MLRNWLCQLPLQVEVKGDEGSLMKDDWPSTITVKDCCTLCRGTTVCLERGTASYVRRHNTENRVNSEYVCSNHRNLWSSSATWLPKCGPSSYKHEFGNFFSGESDQPKRKDLKFLSSEVLRLKNSTLLSYRKPHSQQVPWYINNFLLAFCFSYWNISKLLWILKHLKILDKVD